MSTTGVLTFMFTDIEGSTRAWEASPQTMRDALRTHDEILERETLAHNGRVFKRVGDGFCCVFELPADAIEAAIAIQQALGRQRWPGDSAALRARIGIHCGTAIKQADDYFGPTLNLVSRLMSSGHGGQILVSSAASLLLRNALPGNARLKELGSYRLRDIQDPETIFQLIAAGLREDYPALRTSDSRRNNLPAALSSFIGRATELDDLRGLVSSERLVSICGPGGVGKTSILTQLANRFVDEFADGVWIVMLAALNDATFLAKTICAALGVDEVPGEQNEKTLLRYLSTRTLLLCLDNAEHLVSDTAPLVQHILEQSPGVKVITTTREPLHVKGEHVYRIAPMLDDDAIELFAERIRQVDHAFQVDFRSEEQVRAICRRLQGIPLAIELAAARAASFSLSEIRRRLEQQLSFLTVPSAEDDRHRTLKETIAWSFDLLPPAQRALLSAVSVFSGGFAIDSIQAVAPKEAGNVIDGLAALCDKSFVYLRRNGSTRYGTLDIIAAYANAETAAAPRSMLRKKHAEYFLALCARANEALPGQHLATWLQQTEPEIPNIRSALSYAFEHSHKRLGEALCGLWRYWYVRRQTSEGRGWLERYVDRADPDDPLLPRALRCLSAFASLEHNYDIAAELANAAAAIYLRKQDESGLLAVHHALAVNEFRRGNIRSADELYSGIIERARTSSDRAALVVALRNRATLKLISREFPEAGALLSEASDEATKTGSALNIAALEGLRGTLQFEQGDIQGAQAHFDRAIEMAQSLGNEYLLAELLLAVAAVELQRSDKTAAVERIKRALELSLKLDSVDLAAPSLETIAELALANNHWEEAMDVFAQAVRIRKAYGYGYSLKLGRHALIEKLKAHSPEEFDKRFTRAAPAQWKTLAAQWLAALSQKEAAALI